jgi:hypothetical protein
MDDTRLASIRLASAGYGNGDPRQIIKWPVDLVFDTLAFETFQTDWHRTRDALNQPPGAK